MMNILPPGHRAVGIRVSSEQIASGFAAVPHSRIDIACTVHCNIERENGTRIILQNVSCLPRPATMREEGGKAMVCEVVTVALTPEDAQKLETSKNKGGITMFLRPFGESATVKTRLITWDDVIQSKKNNGKKTKTTRLHKLRKRIRGVYRKAYKYRPVPQRRCSSNSRLTKLVQRITNDTIVKHTYTKDADGNYETHSELIRPHVNSSSNTPDARSAQPPSPAAAAPTTKQ